MPRQLFLLFSPKSLVLCMLPCSNTHPKSKHTCFVLHSISSLFDGSQGDIAHMLPFFPHVPVADHINQICHFFADPGVSFKAIINSPGSHYCFNEAGGKKGCDKSYTMWIERCFHSLTGVSQVFAGKP